MISRGVYSPLSISNAGDLRESFIYGPEWVAHNVENCLKKLKIRPWIERARKLERTSIDNTSQTVATVVIFGIQIYKCLSGNQVDD